MIRSSTKPSALQIVKRIAKHKQGITANDREHFDALQKTGFWGKQGAGCLFLCSKTGRILIGHRSERVEQPLTWGTFGGAIDSKEDAKQAVLREVEEETGYRGNTSNIVPLLVYKKAAFHYHNFLVVVGHEFTPRLNWENKDAKWFDFGQWPKPLHFGLQELFKDAQSMAIIKQIADLSKR